MELHPSGVHRKTIAPSRAHARPLAVADDARIAVAAVGGRINRASWPAAWLVAALAAGLLAAQTPTFRTGVEIFQLDVSVLDQNRRPVRGLLAQDFTVLEDDKPQRIVGFAAIDVPKAPEVAPAVWSAEVAPDVSVNTRGESRIVVLIVDDATLGPDPFMLKSTKAVGRQVVDRLGPSDLAAVVFTQDNRWPQNFTADHSKLIAAIDRTNYGNVNEYSYLSSVETLWEVCRYLIEIPNRRKIVIYLGGGIPVRFDQLAPEPITRPSLRGGMGLREVNIRLAERTGEIFQQAQRANVAIYPIDVCGLRPPGAIVPRPCDTDPFRLEFLQVLAENSGGRAIINTNDFGPPVEGVFRENDSYYLLGYSSESPKGEGHFRRIDIRVNRANVEVRARTRHFAELDPVKSGSPPASARAKALAGLLPKSDIELRVSAAPFVIPGRRDVALAVLTLSANGLSQGTVVPTGELTVLFRAFDPEGRPRGSREMTIPRSSGSGSNLDAREIIGGLELRAGHYEIRAAVEVKGTERSGSVYADLEVPDFGREALSLSGIVLGAEQTSAVRERHPVISSLPVVPTAVRAFNSADRVDAFLRIYVGNRTKTQGPVQFTARILDQAGAQVHIVQNALEPANFDASTRAADVRFPLPLATLSPGLYLLRVLVKDENLTAQRAIPFLVR